MHFISPTLLISHLFLACTVGYAEVEDQCFKVFPEATFVNRDFARAYCRYHGNYLPSFDSQEEWDQFLFWKYFSSLFSSGFTNCTTYSFISKGPILADQKDWIPLMFGWVSSVQWKLLHGERGTTQPPLTPSLLPGMLRNPVEVVVACLPSLPFTIGSMRPAQPWAATLYVKRET